MKKVIGQNKRTYELDERNQKSLFDGICYPIKGARNLWVMLLDDTSKERQMEVEDRIIHGGRIDGKIPQEIVYRGGRFAGFVYSEQDASDRYSIQTEPDVQSVHPEKNKIDGTVILDNAGVRIMVIVALCILLILFNQFGLYPVYLSMLKNTFSADVYAGCVLISVSGITSCVGGILLMFGTIWLFMKRCMIAGPIFLLLESISFLGGVILVDVLTVIVVYTVISIVNFILAIIPTMIMIGIVIYIINKKVLKK